MSAARPSVTAACRRARRPPTRRDPPLGSATVSWLLMIELSDEFRLDAPLEDASWTCRDAVANMDWQLEAIEPQRLVLKKGLRLDLFRIEVLLSEAGPDATTVTFRGRLRGGFGPWDKRTLRSLMNTLRNAIEVAARKSHKQR